MNHFSRFVRALSPICAVFIAGAALVSGRPALAATPSFNLTPPLEVHQPRPLRDAFVPVGITPTSPAPATALSSTGGFSTLLGPTTPSSRGFRLVQATGTVVQFEKASYEVTEGQAFVRVALTRTGDTSGRTIVTVTSTNGAAVEGQDFSYPAATSPAFDPSIKRITIDIPIIDDAISEPQETFRLTLSNPTSIPANTTTLGTNVTTDVTIDDDDSAVQFAQTALTVAETNATLSLTVSRTGVTTGPATVNYTFTDGTATNGSDYAGQNGSITFAANQTTQTINVGIKADTLDEIDENFSVVLSIPQSNTNTSVATGGDTEVITITDDDNTLVGIELPTYQVSEGGGSATVNVVRSGDVSRAISVRYQTINGSATSGSDYTNTNGTLNFAANQITQTITIPILNDAIPENTEDFSLRLFNPAFVPTLAQNIPITLSPNTTATISILDDDPAVNFAATTYAVNEADGTVTVTVVRTGSTAGMATVTYATANGTATAGQDYTAQNGTLTFAPGVSTQTIVIPIINDTANENAETFTVTLLTSANTDIGPNSTTTISITDDDAIPSLTIADVSQAEGNSTTTSNNLVFTVTLSAISGKDVVVTYMTQDATATDGYTSTGATSAIEDTDYIAQPKPPGTTTVTIKAGSPSATITVPIVGDTKFENDESLVVALTAATNATIDRKKAVGTIINDDAAPASTFSFSPATVSVPENVASGTVTLIVTRTGDTTTAASVTVATADGTANAGADYTAIPPTVLTFGAGVTSQTVTIRISDESTNEANETFTATLSNPQGFAGLATDGTATATITIINDDAVPNLSIAPASVTEGDSGTVNLLFQVTIDASSEQTITVQYATADGTAQVADNDYVATSGTLTFAPGERSKTITVVVNGDTNIESTETLSVNLTGAQNVTLSSSSATGTIVNDDTPPTFSNVTLASTTASVTEGTPTVVLTVQRTTGTDRIATIDYATADGTATAGSDYTATSGTVTFAVGQTSATITVPITDDTLQELGAPETFTVTLSNPGGNAVLPAQTTATVSITDNDGTPTLSIADTSVAEGSSGNTPMVFTVSLSPQSQSTVTVQIATTTDGTATSGADFSPATATLTFAPGVATQTFTVNVKGDVIVEPDETVTVKLSNPQGAPIANGGDAATGTIINDDVPGGGGTISFLSASYAANENAINTGQTPVNSVTITLGRTGNVDMINQQSATVHFVTGSGTATPNKDYRPVNKTVTFAAGQTTASIIIPLLNDNLFELDENVSLLISNPSNNAILGEITKATLTIADDDPQSSIPRADSLTPSTSVGSPFTVQATYSSDFGVNDLNPVLIQIGGNANGGGLRALYTPKTNLLSLDPSTGQTAKPGSRVLLTNQFGSLDASQTKVLRSGSSITVTWTFRLTSKTALPIYLGATGSSGQSVFVRKGTWRPSSTSADSTNNS